MADSNNEILTLMKRLGSGQSTGGKVLKFDPNKHTLVQTDALDPVSKTIVKKIGAPNDPDNLIPITADEANQFFYA